MSITSLRLKEMRLKAGLNQNELSRIVEISHTQIARYEKGTNSPTSDILALLARALHTSGDYLLGLTDDPRPLELRSDIEQIEERVLNAWRRGDRESAISIILGDRKEMIR